MFALPLALRRLVFSPTPGPVVPPKMESKLPQTKTPIQAKVRNIVKEEENEIVLAADLPGETASEPGNVSEDSEEGEESDESIPTISEERQGEETVDTVESNGNDESDEDVIKRGEDEVQENDEEDPEVESDDGLSTDKAVPQEVRSHDITQRTTSLSHEAVTPAEATPKACTEHNQQNVVDANGECGDHLQVSPQSPPAPPTPTLSQAPMPTVTFDTATPKASSSQPYHPLAVEQTPISALVDSIRHGFAFTPRPGDASMSYIAEEDEEDVWEGDMTFLHVDGSGRGGDVNVDASRFLTTLPLSWGPLHVDHHRALQGHQSGEEGSMKAS